MEILRKYIISIAALVLWVISALIFNGGSQLLFGIAIGAFLFEQGIAPTLSEQLKKLVKL